MQFVLKKGKVFDYKKKREKRTIPIPMFVNYVSISSPLHRQTAAIDFAPY